MSKKLDKIESHVKDAFAHGWEGFRPCAYFDERLDCIRVITRDCSVLETRINPVLTLLEDNYHSESKGKRYVGFTIKGASHFCHQRGISLAAPVSIGKLLDAIAAQFPETLVQLAVEIAKPIVQEEPRIGEISIPTDAVPIPA